MPSAISQERPKFSEVMCKVFLPSLKETRFCSFLFFNRSVSIQQTEMNNYFASQIFPVNMIKPHNTENTGQYEKNSYKPLFIKTLHLLLNFKPSTP